MDIWEYNTTLSTQYPVVMRSKKRKCCFRSPSRVLYTGKRPYSTCSLLKTSRSEAISAQGRTVLSAAKRLAACQAREPSAPATASCFMVPYSKIRHLSWCGTWVRQVIRCDTTLPLRPKEVFMHPAVQIGMGNLDPDTLGTGAAEDNILGSLAHFRRRGGRITANLGLAYPHDH